jgi:DNA-binding response OmpR family regulator
MTRILLIDDDDSVRTMLRLNLTQFGHTVIEARDGKEGVEKFGASGATLVITDIVMPEKEGLEVLMELRKAHPTLKVIAMSGGGRVSAVDCLHMASLLGAVKVLTKPFAMDELKAAIDALESLDREENWASVGAPRVDVLPR